MKATHTAALLALLLTGCAAEFAPPSFLASDEARLLAVELSPLDAQPGETVTATPRVFVPAASATPAVTWRFCPITAGARAGYACLLPACETSLAPEPDGRVTFDPTALALACVEALGGAGGSAAPTALPEVVEMILMLEIEGRPGLVQTSVARLPYYPGGAPTPRNRAPVIAAIEIGGVAASTVTPAAPVAVDGAVTWSVRTDPASLDAYADALDRPRTEEPIVSYYSTAGRFESDRSSGVDTGNVLEAIELAPADREATTYLVVRDGRGGQAVAGPFSIPIRR